MDPGNYGTEIQAGASLNYSLLWVVWLSSGMAMFLQFLSGKLGIELVIVTRSYSRKIEEEKIHNTLLVSCRGHTAATDLARYLGTVVMCKWLVSRLYFYKTNIYDEKLDVTNTYHSKDRVLWFGNIILLLYNEENFGDIDFINRDSKLIIQKLHLDDNKSHDEGYEQSNRFW